MSDKLLVFLLNKEIDKQTQYRHEIWTKLKETYPSDKRLEDESLIQITHLTETIKAMQDRVNEYYV